MSQRVYNNLATARDAVREALLDAAIESADLHKKALDGGAFAARQTSVGWLLGVQWLARQMFPALERDGLAEVRQDAESEALYLIEAVLDEVDFHQQEGVRITPEEVAAHIINKQPAGTR